MATCILKRPGVCSCKPPSCTCASRQDSQSTQFFASSRCEGVARLALGIVNTCLGMMGPRVSLETVEAFSASGALPSASVKAKQHQGNLHPRSRSNEKPCRKSRSSTGTHKLACPAIADEQPHRSSPPNKFRTFTQAVRRSLRSLHVRQLLLFKMRFMRQKHHS